MSCGTENIKVEPMDIYMGTDLVQIQTITCLGDTADSLDGRYAFFYDSAGAKRYFWFNTSGGSAVDPAIAGYTAHVVAITTGASSSAVATALAAVLTAVSGFDAAASGYVVTLTATSVGSALPAHDAQATAGKTGFAFGMSQVGDLYEKLGVIDGDIEISGLGSEALDITSHQTGTDVIGQIFTGSANPDMSFALKEFTFARLEKIKRYTSGSYLPVGGSNTLVGFGSKGQFSSPQYARVVMHPVRLQAADKTNDLCFWKCLINMDSITPSGENVITLPVTVKAFKDCDKPDGINIGVYGDWTQSLA
jgi:hypothetical protein